MSINIIITVAYLIHTIITILLPVVHYHHHQHNDHLLHHHHHHHHHHHPNVYPLNDNISEFAPSPPVAASDDASQLNIFSELDLQIFSQ